MAKLTTAAVKGGLAGLEGWKRVGNAIRKQYSLPDFRLGMFFVNTAVDLAEKAGRHPDIGVTYNRVTLTLPTHDAGGLTRKDFDLAG